MTVITKTQTEIKTLEGRIAHLNAQYLIQHPNHCTKCGGVGGTVSPCGDGWNEPLSEDWDDCSSCLGQNLNPLDITKTISDEDAEAHAEMMLEGGHPILSKINELEVELHYEEMYLAHLEEEEAEREWLEREHERAMREAAEDEQSYLEFYSDYN
jgi:hypothetical protein